VREADETSPISIELNCVNNVFNLGGQDVFYVQRKLKSQSVHALGVHLGKE